MVHHSDSVGSSIRINAPIGHVVGMEIRGISPSIAEVQANPFRDEAYMLQGYY